MWILGFFFVFIRWFNCEKRIESKLALHLYCSSLIIRVVTQLMFVRKCSFKNLKDVLLRAGFVVLVVWVAVMIFSFILLMFSFSVPEVLISPEFVLSCLGISTIYYNLTAPKRKIEEKAGLLPFICHLIIGTCLILYFVQAVITLSNHNLFTYLCFIIGLAVIFFNVR